MNNTFWNWVKNEENTLRIDGIIAEESWWGDEVTPKQFKSELSLRSGDITVWINSPGGDVFAGSQIYTMLKEHDGNITVKVDGLAASAASVIAMAGDSVEMSPSAMLMIHNPATMVFGESGDFEGAIAMLNEVKESIINVYELKTGMSRLKISNMMDAETWLSAKRAVEMGFADKMLYKPEQAEEQVDFAFNSFMFDKRTVVASLANKLTKKKPQEPAPQNNDDEYKQLSKRLELIK